MCAYALYGTEPDLEKLSDSAAVAFLLIRPNLDASRRKAANGKLGGAGRQGGSKPKANGKQGQAASEKEKENEIENENEIEKENEIEIDREIKGENESYLPCPNAPEREQLGSIPRLEQVEELAKESGCLELAKPFYDYYAAAGWRDSRGTPVYSWQQKFQAWKLREEKRGKKPEKPWVYDPGSLEGSL